jgi:3-deoxy-D-manno-octulosonate 8-phosphate phosphatase (KDO 8-P phosphatase)
LKKDLTAKFRKIKLLLLDVDGVMTNGEIIYDHEGKEIKVFNVQDGFGLVMARHNGVKTAICSARSCPAVQARAEDLKIDMVIQDAQPKSKAYDKILAALKVSDQEVCFIADDLTDLNVFKKVGVAVAVANAVTEIKKEADLTTNHEGGKGAVREVVELILKAQGKWAGLVESFRST